MISARKKVSYFGAGFALLAVATGCGARNTPAHKQPSFQNAVTSADTSAEKKLGDSPVVALGSEKVQQLQAEGKVIPVSSDLFNSLPAHLKFTRPRGDGALAGTPSIPAAGTGVLVSLPLDSLGLSYVFGGVITKVSNKDNEDLGGLKLSEISTAVVRPLLSQLNNTVYVSLVGCLEGCSEGSERKPLVDLPVLGLNADQTAVVVDLAPLASNLKIQDLEKGEFPAEASTKSTSTTLVDYSGQTLIFDITSKMELSGKNDDDTPLVTPFDLTTRYFLRAENTLDSSFISRPNVPGLGFFTTDRTKNSNISRFSLSSFDGAAPVHYYLKNVPQEFQASFDKAMQAWAGTFKMLTSRDILTWEFVKPDSDLQKNLVAGDVRFNIVEWDVDNAATYGGLGPTISNNSTGQALSANVLVQGPIIVDIYSKWFESWKKARQLQSEGRVAEATRLMHEFDVRAAKASAHKTKARMALNSAVKFNIPSSQESLGDPIVKGEFFTFPENQTYESYMDGYFQDLLSHEMGHNFGLRHNFRGNLGRAGEMPEGRVSVSVMEYLDRNFRNRDSVGEYDVMALSYGYTGATPARTDLFCTDEEKASLAKDENTLKYHSPECSTDDGSIDAFGYHTASLAKGFNLLLAPDSKDASPWAFAELKGRFTTYLTGALAYSAAAADTFSTWTNWTGKPGLPTRPTNAQDARIYIGQKLQATLCNTDAISAAVAAKPDTEAQRHTLTEVKAALDFTLDFANTKAHVSASDLADCVAALKAVADNLAKLPASAATPAASPTPAAVLLQNAVQH